MNTIKICMFIMMAVFTTTNSHAQQSNTVDCSKDSLLHTSLIKYLDTIEARKMELEKVNKIAFGTNREKDCFCDLLIYAKVFDFLLTNGLDLEYNFTKTPYIINSTSLPPASEHIISLNEGNKKNKIYIFYLEIKEDFETNLMTQYENNQSRSLQIDVTNIIRHNIYRYPSTLKSMLLTKNAQALKAKLYAEIKVILGDD